MEKKLPCVVTSLGTSDRNTPERPPIRKLKNHARQNSIGTVYRICPRQSVIIPQRKVKPVGIEISSVESM